jgi:hypothetical protein
MSYSECSKGRGLLRVFVVSPNPLSSEAPPVQPSSDGNNSVCRWTGKHKFPERAFSAAVFQTATIEWAYV